MELLGIGRAQAQFAVSLNIVVELLVQRKISWSGRIALLKQEAWWKFLDCGKPGQYLQKPYILDLGNAKL